MSGMMNYSSGGLTIDPLTGRLVYPGQAPQQPPSPMSLPGILNSPAPDTLRANPTSIPSGGLNYPGGLGIDATGRLVVPPQSQAPRTGPAFPQAGSAMPKPADPLGMLKGGYGALQSGYGALQGGIDSVLGGPSQADPAKFAAMDNIAPSQADPAKFAAMDLNSLPSNQQAPAAAVQAPPSPTPSASPSPTPPAQKDPLGDLKSKIAAGESSYGHASGNLYGFIPSTWSGFVKQSGGKYTDKDITNPQAQEEAYSWNMSNNAAYLKKQLGSDPSPALLVTAWNAGPAAAAAFAKSPDADAYTLYASLTSPAQADAAFKSNPGTLVKGDTAQQAIDRTAAFYDRQGAGGPHGDYQTAQGDAPTSNVMQTVTAPDGSPAPGQQPQGNRGDDIQKSILALRADPNDKLMALASGLLAGPTFNTGLSKGLQAVGELNASDRNLGLQAANARAQMGYKDALLGLNGQKLAQKDQVDQAKIYQNSIRLDQQGRRIDQQGNLIDARIGGNLNPVTQALFKSSQKDASDLSSGATDALKQNEDIANVRKIISEQPNTIGRDAMSRMSQFLSTSLGVPINGVTPSGFDIASKDVNDLANSMRRSAAGGRISRMPLGEFNAIGQGILSMGTNRDAALHLLDQYEKLNNRTIGAASAWENMDPEDRPKALLKSGGFKGWLNGYMQAQDGAQSGNAQGGGPQASPTVQQTPSGAGWQSTGSGVRWQVN